MLLRCIKLVILASLFTSLAHADGPTPPPLRVREQDGSPDVRPVFDIKVSNGTLTNEGSGVVSLTTSGGSGTPGGTDRDLQFNDGGSFGGDRVIQWYKTPNTLVISRDSGQKSQPAIIISGDSNNVLATLSHDGGAYFQYLDVANTLSVDAANQRVGIGNFTPTDTLDVKAATTPFVATRWTDATSYGGLRFYENSSLFAGFLTIGSNFATSSRRKFLEFQSLRAGGGLSFWTSTNGQSMTITDANGYTGINVIPSVAQLEVVADSSTTIGETITGAASQSANLVEWRNSAGGILSDIEEDGILKLSTDAVVTTNATGEVGFDTNAHATGRGTVQLYDGTQSAYVVAVQAGDTPSDGQVATWHTGGVVSWDAASGGSPSGANNSIQFNSSSTFAGDDAFIWSPTSNTLSISRDSGQVGKAFVISSDTGANLANISHDGGATFNSLTLANRLSADSGGTGNAVYAAKGDLLASSGTTTLTRLAVGADGTVLSADASQTTGLKYVTIKQHKVFMNFPVQSAKLSGDNAVRIDAGLNGGTTPYTMWRLLFQSSDSTQFTTGNNVCMWQGRMDDNWQGGSLTAKIDYCMISSDSDLPANGQIQYGVSIWAYTSGDATSLTTESYDTENTKQQQAPTTISADETISIPLTNIDSLAPGDWFIVKLRRIGNMAKAITGDAAVIGFTITE